MKLRLLLETVCTSLLIVSCSKEPIIIVASEGEPRIEYGVGMFKNALKEAGYDNVTECSPEEAANKEGRFFFVNIANDSLLNSFPDSIRHEAFRIFSKDQCTMITGADASGAMYGCIELCDRLKDDASLSLPENIIDAPSMVLRGACVGVQKPYYLPGRTVYEYPYTPETFPWFYDKDLWIKYLDMLAANRMNSLYLWNGHPFASLVRLDDYPFAVEVDSATFAKNEEMFAFLTHEADRRGIFVIQMFYNIIVSKPFAEHYDIKTQDRNRPITPLLSDYTRKSIAAFIEKYPNVGLLACLGEAIATVDDDVDWFVNTIIPGVKDGLKARGITKEPPLLLRAHDTDCKLVMDEALKHYKNLYTMHKYNGESLTTYEPRGPWAKIHTDLSSLGSIHISNVHILANLEPFRYGSPNFIRRATIAMHERHGANALHLYPQASYWDWPYTADKLPDGKREEQIDRDWIWYQAWARYAWQSYRDSTDEMKYWSRRIDDFYDCGTSAGENIVKAYDEIGEIAPKLLRRFGITEGNRQTLLLGMFMSQLVNPYKYTIYPGFYESCGPEGEKLIEYVEKEWKHQPHIGELPLDVTTQVVDHGARAVKAIDAAKSSVNKNTDEFQRLRNDVYCYNEFAQCFDLKVKAARAVLDYQWGGDINKLDEAIPLLEQSLVHYRKLVDLTKDTYLYANSMQTAQRRIPIGGDNGKNKTWEEMLPHYEKELAALKHNIEVLRRKANGEDSTANSIAALNPATVKYIGYTPKTTALTKGTKLFTDMENATIDTVSEELRNMQAFILNGKKQRKEATSLQFETKSPVQLLVGYFRDDQRRYASAPKLEIDASANLYGQAEPQLINAVRINGLPMSNIHVYHFDAGRHTLNLPHGICLVLGFTSDTLTPRDAALVSGGGTQTPDWLFY